MKLMLIKFASEPSGCNYHSIDWSNADFVDCPQENSLS